MCSFEIGQDRGNLSETGRRTCLFATRVIINRASFSSKINHIITEQGPFLTYLYRFGFDRCVCGDKGDPDHYATDLLTPQHTPKLGARPAPCRLGGVAGTSEVQCRMKSRKSGMIVQIILSKQLKQRKKSACNRLPGDETLSFHEAQC
ncbi:hypothetical protein AVEN_171484-1 [Araneus ventricosus]|uniref:Uncharacterized protein n=1 Tax=Araneus ventricosus TaxID=182803 RepID=A0A4Y2HB08_ARAVE|nr:hypothetical protein AVEN_171484-1 [Araneus ventricosus]